MEDESEKLAESTQSGATSAQVDAPTHSSSPENDDPLMLMESEEQEDVQAGCADCDGQAATTQEGEEECTRGPDTSPQETLTATNMKDIAEDLPRSPPLTGEELTPPPVPSHNSNTQVRPAEPCWYCLRSLDSEYRPETPRQENPDPLATPPPSGQKVSYQTDPRPHFGVAWSSHSTCRPLWGSEGPCLGQRHEDVPDQTHSCPHCHLGLPLDTLRWHEAKCLLFEGRNSKK